jgi:hypothetical protein
MEHAPLRIKGASAVYVNNFETLVAKMRVDQDDRFAIRALKRHRSVEHYEQN